MRRFAPPLAVARAVLAATAAHAAPPAQATDGAGRREGRWRLDGRHPAMLAASRAYKGNPVWHLAKP